MGQPMTLTVFGAKGGVGSAVVDQALSRGHRVIGVEPSPVADDREGLTMHEADVMRDDLVPFVAEADAVVSALGLPLSPQTALDPPPLYTEGTLRILKAMRAAGKTRLVVISASFVETLDRGPIWFRAAAKVALGQVFRQMGDMERMLKASHGIEWTAVRPGWLLDAPLTADYTVSDGVMPPEMVRTRIPDVAHFILHCVESGEWIEGTPAVARQEDEEATSPMAVLREVTT